MVTKNKGTYKKLYKFHRLLYNKAKLEIVAKEGIA